MTEPDVPRYPVSAFAPYASDASVGGERVVQFPGGGAGPVAAGDLVLDAGAQPPAELLMALLENEPKARATWERRRRDLADQSASGYEMTLMHMTTACGWPRQARVDLCIMWRRRHGELNEQKILRPDYWERTLARAEGQQSQAIAGHELLTGTDEGDDQARSERLARISRMLGVPVQRIIQHNRQNARYSFRLEDGRDVPIGGAAVLCSNDQFNARLMEATGQTVPAYKKPEWRRIVEAMLAVVDVIETVDATREGTLVELLRGYLADVSENEPVELWQLIDNRLPFYKDGMVFVSPRAFRKHVVLAAMENVELADLADDLRRAGFERARVWGPRSASSERGGRSNAWYWRAPRGVLNDGSEEQGQ